jgi:hypothetical protein
VGAWNFVANYSHIRLKSIIIALCSCFIFLTGALEAQVVEKVTSTETIEPRDEFKHAINMCPGGIAFGIYSINYAQLFGSNHVLVGRFDYEDIPKTYTDANIESSGVAFILNYRWHFSGKMNSTYLGAYSRYRVYNGSGTLESTTFDFEIDELTLGLNVGKRWVWNSGFNLNFALGYGFSFDNREIDPTNTSLESTVDNFESEYDFIDPFLGEFSIGYAF